MWPGLGSIPRSQNWQTTHLPTALSIPFVIVIVIVFANNNGESVLLYYLMIVVQLHFKFN